MKEENCKHSWGGVMTKTISHFKSATYWVSGSVEYEDILLQECKTCGEVRRV